MKNRFVSQARYRKLTEDLEDNINFGDIGTQLSDHKREGKKTFPTTNLFMESLYLGRNDNRHSQRRANVNRTRSSIMLT